MSDAEIRCIHELFCLKIFLILDKLSWVFGCLWGRDSIVYSSVCLHVSRHCVCSSCRSVSSSESSWQTHHWTPGAVPGSRRGKLIFILLINWTSQDFLCFFLFTWLCYMKVTYLKMAKKAQLEEAYCSRLTTNRTKNLRSCSIVYLENNRSCFLCVTFFVFILLFIHSFIYYLVGCPWNCQSDCDGHDGDGNDPSWGQEENLDVW